MDLQICKSSLFVLQLCGKKREAFFDEKKAQKSHFPKRVNPCFWSKKYQFFLYLISVKTRLVVVLLNDFLEKKETFLSTRKNNFSKSRNNAFRLCRGKKTFLALKNIIFFKVKKIRFSKGVNPCFWSKNAIFFFSI